MASLQARHGRSCALSRPWTTFEDAVDSCTCKPLYHVVLRHDGKLVRNPVGRNRKNAARALAKTSVQVDEDEYQPRKDIRFREWVDEWKQSLKRAKDNTKDSYTSTINYAKEAFGDKYVRQLGPTDIDRFLALMGGLTDSTKAKHLRVLGACLKKAVRRGYAPRNPVDDMGEDEKPQVKHRESAYFTNAELPRLFAEIPEGLSRTLFLVALRTGMRQGEIAGLTWSDIEFATQTITVRHNFTAGYDSETKSNRVRHIDFDEDLAQTLAVWWKDCGNPEAGIVFPGGARDGHVCGASLPRHVLYPAMKRAGIDRIGPTGEKRNFHSLRHTYAKIALESGAEIFWLSRQLGHASYTITTDVYGHWETAARKAEAKKLQFPALGARTDARTDESQTTPTEGNGFGTHTNREAAVLHAITKEPEAAQ
jgi:integrase